MKRYEKARNLFLSGYNCSQAVLGAFQDVIGFDFDTTMKLASSFGGGMARMRQVCGTCSAVFMLAGLLKGYADNSTQSKSNHYAFVQTIAKEFSKRNGSIICREILDLRAQKGSSVDNGDSPIANERTSDYYRTRPCCAVVEDAVKLACEMLEISEEDTDDGVVNNF